MVMLAASALSALGLLRLCHVLNTYVGVRKLPMPACHAVVALSCIALFTLEFGYKPLSLIRMPVGLEVPEVYRWLAAEKPGPLVELPAGMWENYKYEYFSTYHWLPLVNGASGYGLPTYGQLVQQLQPLPTREGVMSLSAVGVKAVVVHYDQLPLHEALQWHLAAVELGLEQVAEFGSDLVYRTPASDSTHELELKLLTPDRLPISASIRVGLLVRGIHDRMWLSPRLSQRERVIVEWIEQSTGQTLIEEGSLEWPLASGAKPTTPMGVSVHTPFTQGRYLLTLQIPAFDRKTAPQSIELASNPFPTSANAPQMVSAAYAWEGPQPQLVTTGSIPMRVRTVNTGRAIWLADAEGVRGSVYLRWRWYKEDQEISGLGGREPLTYDVFPGQAFTFQSRIIPPSEPGEYRLDLELFSDLVRRFASRDEPPLQLTVHVLRIVKSDFDTWLTEQSQSIADPPRLTVSTDQRRYRRGDMLNLLVTLDVGLRLNGRS